MADVFYEVMATALNLRDAPNGAVQTVLRAGQRVVAVAEAANGWRQVAAPGGHTGFAADRFLRRADGAAPAPEPAPAAPAMTSAADADVSRRDRDPGKLHPALRSVITTLELQFADEGLPFRVFEAFRTPERQQWLFAQGRTRPGSKVTNAQAWQSFHQYGLAVDWVLFENGTWSWDDSGANQARWARLQALVKAADLNTLAFERPHAEWRTTIARLQAGDLPASGDPSWRDNLERCLARWQLAGQGGGPAIALAERPALPD